MAEQTSHTQILLRRKQVQARTSIPTSTLYAMMARGDFPKPVKISQRAVGWLESDIDEFIARLVDQRQAA